MPLDKETRKAERERRKRLKDLQDQKKQIEKLKKARSKQERKRAKKEAKLAEARLRHKIIQSTQNSIPVRDVLRGVVITDDNRYLKILEFLPQNFLMFSAEQRNRVTEDFQAMLKIVPAKIQIKVFSRKAKVESLMAGMVRHHETETNEMCRKMQEEYIDLIKDTALREGVTRRFFVIVEYADDLGSDGTNFKQIVGSMNTIAARIRNYMQQAGNDYVPSCETDAGVTELLYELLNRRISEIETYETRAGRVFEHYIAAEKQAGREGAPPIPATEFVSPAWIDYKHARHIVIDNKFYTFAYAISNGYPNYVVAGWLSQYVNAGEGVDVDIFLERIPRDKIQNRIGRQIRLNRAKLNDSSDTGSDYNDVASTISSGLYLKDGLSAGLDFYYTNIIFTVCSDSLETLNWRYNEFEKMAAANGLKIRRATFQMEQAFESTLPLCKIDPSIKRKSRQNMLSTGAASLYPFISYELQDPNGIMLGINKSNNSLTAIDVFDSTRHANANGAILGKSGYGKTFTAQLLAIRMRLQNIQTFIITPLKGKEDYKRAADQINGQYIAFGPGSPYYINILDIIVPDDKGTAAIDGQEMDQSLLAKKVQSLHTFMSLVVRDLTQEEEQVLDSYFYQVYEKYGITEDNESVYVPGTKQYKEMPILGDLYELIKDDAVLRRVANILVPLVSGSLSVYNHRTNVDLDNKYIVFDMNGQNGTNLVLSMFVCLDYVWSKIKEDRTKAKAVFIDEAWKLIGSDSNEMAAAYVKEIFKTIRAFGGAAFVMTQEVSDFFSLKNGEYGNAIIGNADTKICLHLDPVEAKKVQEVMQLTNDEIDQIIKLPRGQGLVSTGSTRLFVEFKASPYETDVITTNPEVLRKKIREAEAQKKRMAQMSEQEPSDGAESSDDASDAMDEQNAIEEAFRNQADQKTKRNREQKSRHRFDF